MEKEIWKDIPGYEGKYQINKKGDVKSLNYKRLGFPKKLIPGSDGNGYMCVNLCKDGKPRFLKIYRLLAEIFIPNPKNKSQVNHIDGNKLNNNLSNLEWVTQQENCLHAYRIGLREGAHKGKFGRLHHNSKKINQYDLQGNFIKQWFGSKEPERELGISQSSIIACCKGRYKKTGGYIWKYVNI